MRTASRFLIAIIFLGVVLGGIFSYKFYQFGQMKEMLSQPQPPAEVSATEARTESWTPSIKAVGSVNAVNGIEVANEVPGVISSINFESRSEEHTSELQSRPHLVCRLLLEK